MYFKNDMQSNWIFLTEFCSVFYKCLIFIIIFLRIMWPYNLQSKTLNGIAEHIKYVLVFVSY